MRSVTALLTSLITLPLLAAGSAGAAPADTPSDESGRLVLLLDSSGSMKEPAAGGGAKIDAARSAVRDVVDQLPPSAEVGIRVFGAKVFSRTDAGACTDTQNVVPVGPLDRGRLTSAVEDYEPYGETPIGTALEGAAQDLGSARGEEKRTIVLLSDGEPTCAPNPCVVARKLRDRGIDLRINVVGLDVSGNARSALQCIARAGGGRYFDADSAEELTESMVQVSVRAPRLFSLSGDAVTGGESTADPTAVDPGDYLDETLPKEAPRFYVVDLPRGGSVSASAVMRPEAGDTVDTLRVELLTPDGDRCADDLAQRINVIGLRSIVGTAAHFDSRVEGLNSDECAAAEQLLVAVRYGGPVSPYSLRVRTYPKVANLDALPAPVDPEQRDTWERPVPLAGGGTPIVGGASFEDAPEVAPGTTYTDTLRPREQLIYKVAVKWGQAPRMTARLETDRTADSLQGALGVAVEAQAFNPLGAQLGETFNAGTGVRGSGFYDGSRPATVTAAHPPVRYRNLEESHIEVQRNALAGYYYFTLEMGGDSDRAKERFQAPVRFAVAADGAEQGAPEYDGQIEGEPTEAAAPRTADEPDGTAAQQASRDGFPWTLVTVAAGVLTIVLALVGGVVSRRRRRG